MAIKTSLCDLSIFSLLLGHVIGSFHRNIRVSEYALNELHQQPYRASFHFQPHNMWIYYVEISLLLSEFEKAELFDPGWTTNPKILCSQKDASIRGSLGPFGLLILASRGLQELTSVSYKVLRRKNEYVVLMCSDQSRSSLNQEIDKTAYGAYVDVNPVHEKLSLRSLVLYEKLSDKAPSLCCNSFPVKCCGQDFKALKDVTIKSFKGNEDEQLLHANLSLDTLPPIAESILQFGVRVLKACRSKPSEELLNVVKVN